MKDFGTEQNPRLGFLRCVPVPVDASGRFAKGIAITCENVPIPAHSGPLRTLRESESVR